MIHYTINTGNQVTQDLDQVPHGAITTLRPLVTAGGGQLPPPSDAFALASGLHHGEACRRFIALAGNSPVSSVPCPPRPKLEDVDRAKADASGRWPSFESPSGISK